MINYDYIEEKYADLPAKEKVHRTTSTDDPLEFETKRISATEYRRIVKAARDDTRRQVRQLKEQEYTP